MQRAAFALYLIFVLAGPAWGQQWPTKPLRIETERWGPVIRATGAKLD